MTIMIDTYPIPETGWFNLKIERAVEINISATQARRRVQRWVSENITHMLQAKEPTLTIGERVVWRVPVNLTASHVGQVGNVGEVDVDVQTGKLQNVELEQMQACALRLVADLPPYTPRTLSPEFIPQDIERAPMLEIDTNFED